MLEFLRRVRNDLIQGENIDAYIIIAVALVLSVWSLVASTPQDLLPGVTLSVLTLLTISTLVSRHRLDDIRRQTSISSASVFFDEYPSSFSTDIELANELWLFGVSHDNIINQYYSLLERKLRQGHIVRVLVINPYNEEVLKISEMRAYVNPSVQRAKNKIRSGIDDFCKLHSIAPERMLIRVVDFPIAERLVVVNPSSHIGKFYVAHYAFRTPNGPLPIFTVTAQDTQWFKHYTTEAQNLWDAGLDWQCESSAKMTT